jgi:4-hydroxy-tetrahydrodipicolinate synthase
MTSSWPSLWTAMVTPFTAEGDLDANKAADLAAWLVDQGSEGLVLAGTTGESPTLSDAERYALWRAVADAVGSRVPIFMGTGHNSTRQAVAWSRDAASWGVDGVMVVTPYYNKPPQAGLAAHFAAVAAAVPCPVMLYNVPGRTGVHLAVDTTRALMRAWPQIRLVKEASGRLDVIADLARDLPDGAAVLTGEDAQVVPALASGAAGVVSVMSHVAGPAMRRMLRAWRDGDVRAALRWHLELEPLARELFRISSPLPVKWALARIGHPVGPCRLPLQAPADMDWRPLEAALQAAGVLPDVEAAG